METVTYSVHPEQDIEIVQLTDSHLFAERSGQLLGVNTHDSFTAVLEAIKGHDHLKLVLATGDISHLGEAQSYQDFVSQMAQLDLPCHYLPGNHDDSKGLTASLSLDDTELQAKFYGQPRILLGPWQILLLDSSVPGKESGYLSPQQLEDVKGMLSLHPEKYTLVVMHHHPLAVNSHWLDQHKIVNGQDLLALSEQFPHFKGVLFGHVHQEVDEQFQGANASVRILGSPSTCVQFTPLSDEFALDLCQPGYRLLTLTQDGQILTQVKRLKGKRFLPETESQGY